MRFSFEESEQLLQLCSIIKDRLAALTADLKPVNERLIIPLETNVYERLQPSGVFVLREGMLRVLSEDRELFTIEEGDPIFIVSDQKFDVVISSDFAVIGDYYQLDQFQSSKTSLTNLFCCVGAFQALYTEVIKSLHRGERNTTPSIRSFRKGEAIVTEGEISDQVFTLIEGHAVVSSQGEQVGEIKVDELIGVIGALCNVPRIATVTASEDSLAMALSKDDFIDLLSLRPHTVIKLIEDFARIISSSNQMLKELRSKA